MNALNNPNWIEQYLFDYKSYKDISGEVIDKINQNLAVHKIDPPVISIIIPAYNEEFNILSCVASIAANRCEIPFEVIVVDNNSTDNTQKLLEKLDVRYYFESKVGPGAARQLGQEKALGKFILTADGDCIYPPLWVKIMYEALNKRNTTCVYGRYSFIGTSQTPRWQLFIYEKLKDVLSEIRHIKRPHLNSLGMSMGYPRALGLEVGFDTRSIILEDGSVSFVRGEDGRLCFDLNQKGKVRQVRSSKARLWTFQRTLSKDGTLWNSLKIRVKKELAKFHSYLKSHPPHDTKRSIN